MHCSAAELNVNCVCVCVCVCVRWRETLAGACQRERWLADARLVAANQRIVLADMPQSLHQRVIPRLPPMHNCMETHACAAMYTATVWSQLHFMTAEHTLRLAGCLFLSGEEHKSTLNWSPWHVPNWLARERWTVKTCVHFTSVQHKTNVLNMPKNCCSG